MDLRAYEQAGGYQAIRKVLHGGMTAKAVTNEVKEANLRGRGGAGFPTGVKWSFVPLGKDVPNPTYLVCNADEMEPGTFKDRLLMEQDPHQLIEGMIVSGFAIEADVAYIFLRGEYVLAAERLSRAIADAYDTITSERTYKKARTPEDAFLELERCASNQFDPSLVRVFIETMRCAPRQTVEAGVSTSEHPSDPALT